MNGEPSPKYEAPALRTIRTLAIGSPNWIGDAVMMEPLLRALVRDGRFAIVLWCRPRLRDLCRTLRNHLPSLEVATYDGDVARLSPRLAAEHTLWISLAMTPDLPSLARRCGARFVWGFPQDDTAHLLGQSLGAEFVDRGQHHVRNYLAVLPRLGIDPPHGTAVPYLEVRAGRGRRGNVRNRRRVVVVNTSSSNQPSKRYPASGFVELANLLLGRFPDVRILLTGLADDAERNARIAAQTCEPARCVDHTGRYTLARFIEVLAGARLVISNDTGPMHVAAALGVATIGIFGPTSPAWTAPLGPRAHHVATRAPCAPCFASPCPLPEQICFDDVSPVEVVRLIEAHELL